MTIKLSIEERKWLVNYLKGLQTYAKERRTQRKLRERLQKKLEEETDTVKLSTLQYNFIANFLASVVKLADIQLGRLRKPAWYEFWKVSRNTKLKAIEDSLLRSKQNAQKLIQTLKAQGNDGTKDKQQKASAASKTKKRKHK